MAGSYVIKEVRAGSTLRLLPGHFLLVGWIYKLKLTDLAQPLIPEICQSHDLYS